MNKQPLVSIIILNWNGKELLQECLSSIDRLNHSPVEIIVVDNNSTDGSREWLATRPGIMVIENKENIGYAMGNNAGFKAAGGVYCAVLNNDMVVDPGWLDEPVRVFEKEPDVGIISCRQMRYDNREIIDGLYHYLTPTLKAGVAGEGERYGEKSNHSRPGYVLSANGGSMIARKSLIDQLGGFDTRFFAYSEDFDLCLRAFLVGWRCVYLPSAVVYHKRSASFGRNPGRKLFFEWRNRYFILYKFFPLCWIVRHCYWILWNEWRTIGRIFFKIKQPMLYFSIWRAIICRIGAFTCDRRENQEKFRKKEREIVDFMRRPIHPVSL